MLSFFCDLLEHLLVQEQVGDESLATIEFEFQFATPAVRIDPLGILMLSPAIVSRRRPRERSWRLTEWKSRKFD